MKSLQGDGATLDVIHLRRKVAPIKMEALFFFGMHARELISSETGFQFVRRVCQGHAKGALDRFSFTVVPNANPSGRSAVEAGDFCKRTNSHGVDINRNWGMRWQHLQAKPGSETNPGEGPFSEPETRLLNAIVKKSKPGLFLDVHSGAYLLGTPWSYSKTKDPHNEQSLLQLLRPISDKYCRGLCPFGNAALLVNYDAPGTDMDYVMKHYGAKYSFTWEIYAGNKYRQPYIERALGQRSGQASLYEAWTAPQVSRTSEECLYQFNPLTEAATKNTMSTWSRAFLDLTMKVSAAMRRASLRQASERHRHRHRKTSAFHATQRHRRRKKPFHAKRI